MIPFILLPISIFLVIFVPFSALFTSAIGILFDKKNAKIYLLLFVVVISLPILRYSPAFGDDSSWHYFAASEFSKFGSFSELMSSLDSGNGYIGRYNYSEIPVFTYLMYLFSDTFTYSLISFVVCIITYYCYTLPAVDYYQKNRVFIRYFSFAILAIFLLNNYRYTTSGMRYCLSSSITMMLIYFDSKTKKSIGRQALFFLLYAIPLLIHPAVIYFIFIRFLYLLIKTVKWCWSLAFFLAFPLLIFLIPYVADISGIELLKMYSSKIEIYINNDSYEELFTFTMMTRMYIGVLVILLYLFLFLFFRNAINSINYKMFLVLTFYFSLFSLGTVFTRNVFDRNLFILYPMIVLSVTFLVMHISDMVNNVNNRNVLYFIVGVIYFLCILIGFFYNKNFPLEYIDYSISELFTKNIFDYFYNLPRFYINTN